MKIFFILLFICLLNPNIMASTRIMLLGDSITYDDAYLDHPELGGNTPRPASERHGYRNHLWYLLKDAQYDVDFVGSRIAGTDITPPLTLIMKDTLGTQVIKLLIWFIASYKKMNQILSYCI